MPQSFALLLLVLSVSFILYARHRRAVRKRREWMADHRAMVNYLSAVDDEFGGYRGL